MVPHQLQTLNISMSRQDLVHTMTPTSGSRSFCIIPPSTCHPRTLSISACATISPLAPRICRCPLRILFCRPSRWPRKVWTMTSQLSSMLWLLFALIRAPTVESKRKRIAIARKYSLCGSVLSGVWAGSRALGAPARGAVPVGLQYVGLLLSGQRLG